MLNKEFENRAGINYIDILVALTFLFLGVNIYLIYLPLVVLVFIFIIIKDKKIVLTKELIVMWFLIGCGIVLPYLIGILEYSANLEAKNFILLLFFVFVIFYIFSRIDLSKKKMVIVVFFFGIFLKSILFTMNHYFMFKGVVDTVSAYGQLYNPLTGEFTNSPIYSLGLIPFTIYLTLNVFGTKKISIQVLMFLGIALSFFSANILAGRAYFIIYILVMLLYLLTGFEYNWRRFLYLFTVLIALMVLALSFRGSVADVGDNKLVSRFSKADSSNEARFLRFNDGIDKLIETPVGRFYMDTSYGTSDLFHNLFLDYSKYMGWVPFFSLVFLYGFPFVLLLVFRRLRKQDVSYMFVAIFLIVNQDVFFSSGLPILYGSFFIIYYMSTRVKIHANKL